MSRIDDIDNLISRFLNQDRAALAKIITIIENNPEIARELLTRLPQSSDPYVVGLTGSPGTGKSTLITRMVEYLTEQGHQVGIISVDPSSPIYGGAFLGDRVRMRDIILNPKVFIRSVASRGSMGGLSRAVYDIAHLYGAFGMDYILLETVGAGQSEVDIFRLAYTVLLLTVPGLGDHVQVLKAGILEIADILVINKSDLGGDFLKVNLNMLLESDTQKTAWRPPIVRTIATDGRGIEELFLAIQKHRNYLESSGKLRDKKKTIIHNRVKFLLESQLYKYVSDFLLPPETLEKTVQTILTGSKDIYSAVFDLLEPIIRKIKKN